MDQLMITFETVTPLFLGGSEPRGQPEIRPPSIRGALRYWLRAALGGTIGDKDFGQISSVESLVFGKADEKFGASAVVIRLHNSSLREQYFSELIGSDPKGNRVRYPGMAYLWFSARSTRKEGERRGLWGNFDLTMSARMGAKNSTQRFQEAYAALWLWVNLGGLGSRARRAAGNLRVARTEGSSHLLENLPLTTRAKTPQELAEELGSGIKFCRQLFAASYPKGAVKKPSAFDLLHPEVCKVWVLDKSYGDWQEAVNEFGLIYQGFRSRRQPDYKTVKDAVSSGKDLAKPVERAAFGLPIQFYYRSLNGRGAGLQSENFDRRSSPLLIHVTRLATNQYAVSLVWFRSIFLPDGENLKWVDKGFSGMGTVPDDHLIELFINKTDPVKQSSLRDKLQPIEVNYV
ncbi:MAG: hypothetical protein Kow0088_16730 [Anaerolineales bacterium]